jgi:hypothetical protein
VSDVESPREQARERRLRRSRRRRRLVRAEQRDADRACVEPFRVRADHVLVDAAVPALEHLAVLVDEEVVADVVQPLPFTWYTSIPRTIAADCDDV